MSEGDWPRPKVEQLPLLTRLIAGPLLIVGILKATRFQLQDERPTFTRTNKRIDRVVAMAFDVVDRGATSAEAVRALHVAASKREDLLRAAAHVRSRAFVTDDRRTWTANEYLLASFHDRPVASLTVEQDEWFSQVDALVRGENDEAVYSRLLRQVPGLSEEQTAVLEIANGPRRSAESLPDRLQLITSEVRARTGALLGPDGTSPEPAHRNRTALGIARRMMRRSATRPLLSHR